MSGRYPEVKVTTHLGAQISLLLESGRFKAEFGPHGINTEYAETLKEIKAKIEKKVDERTLAKPIEVVYYNYSEHEIVKLTGIMHSPKGPLFIVMGEGGKTFLTSVVYRATAGLLAAINEEREKNEAWRDAGIAHNEARDGLAVIRDALAVRPAQFHELEAEAEGQ